MTLRVEPGHFRSPVSIPRSKSHANRYLILAARARVPVTIAHLPQSDDVQLLLACLKHVGLAITHTADGVVVANSFPECETVRSSPLELTVGEGGTTARFLLALLATGRQRYVLQTHGRLSQRPWRELTDALAQAGAHVAWSGSALTIQGPVDVSRLPTRISAAATTQFASALQLAFYADNIRITPEGLKTSGPYWEMTKRACQEVSSASVAVPLDWSSAAYPLVCAAVTGDPVLIPELAPDEQADALVFSILQHRGAASLGAAGVTGGALQSREPLDVSVAHCPDLAVALAYLAVGLEGSSVLRDVSVLRQKESDRLLAITELLRQFGVSCTYDSAADSLSITGARIEVRERSVEVPADHRLVMVGALFLLSYGGGTISHPGAVAKSFPEFFRQLIRGPGRPYPKS